MLATIVGTFARWSSTVGTSSRVWCRSGSPGWPRPRRGNLAGPITDTDPSSQEGKIVIGKADKSEIAVKREDVTPLAVGEATGQLFPFPGSVPAYSVTGSVPARSVTADSAPIPGRPRGPAARRACSGLVPV